MSYDGLVIWKGLMVVGWFSVYIEMSIFKIESVRECLKKINELCKVRSLVHNWLGIVRRHDCRPK